MMRIKPQKTTSGSFARFGAVVNNPSVPATSEGPDYRFWSDLAHYTVGGETEIGICTVFARPAPAVEGVERHLRTPEILIPIDGPFILPLVHEEGGKDVVEAFRVETGEAVVINTGVWHGPCIPVDQERKSYFVIFRRGTPHDDVEKRSIDPVEIV